ncbi:hypothetical protein J5690_08190 [bacterium]|nr:hypothetical protein [bacterium]
MMFLSAKEIYEQGYSYDNLDNKLPNNKHFFLLLREAIIKELEQYGFCDYIDSLLDDSSKEIDCVVCSVILDIEKNYKSDNSINIENQQVIPHVISGYVSNNEHEGHILNSTVATYFSWSDCKCKNQITLDISTYLEKIRRVRNIVRKKHKSSMDKTKNEVENTQNSINFIQDLTKEAYQEAEKIRNEAILEAYQEAEKIRNEAILEAKKVNNDAIERAKKKSSELVGQYIYDEQKKYKQEINEEIKEVSASILGETYLIKKTKDDMCKNTNDFQAKFVKALEETKNDFYKHLDEWQKSLFSFEYKSFANLYMELYRIINVDKLICMVLSCEKSDILNELNKLNKTLGSFLKRFEVLLNKLDLDVFYPKSGEQFDEIWHVSRRDDEVGEIIEECICPGIAKKCKDNGEEYDVLIPAEVKVKTEN